LKNNLIKCWGEDTYGQLGDGLNRDSNFAVTVAGLDGNALAVAAGSDHTCAVTEGGVECWGRNIFGQLGTGVWTDSFTPARVIGFSLTAVSIVSGSRHTCALTSAGGVRCWGRNSYGQLGDGTSVDRNSPVDVTGLTPSIP
jgi:alpha-tubulin suppressor-like RCC1 family protein